jgi:ABC-type lipoprotein export system ATPase subunit
VSEQAQIELESLEFHYPRSEFRLQIPHLSVGERERIAITGSSGCGKTTLLNLIAGIAIPAGGTVRVGDTEVGGLSDSERRTFRLTQLGFVFQDFELIDYLNVIDNVLLPCRISGALSLNEAARDRAAQLLDRVGMQHAIARNVTELSQGERQRVAICRAMLPGPQVVLADEATGNLDPDSKNVILDLIFEEAAAEGATLVAVTHDHGLLPKFDRVVDFSALNAGAAT